MRKYKVHLIFDKSNHPEGEWGFFGKLTSALSWVNERLYANGCEPIEQLSFGRTTKIDQYVIKLECPSLWNDWNNGEKYEYD